MKGIRLASSNNNPNFTVESDGRAFISQRETSRLTGVPYTTLNSWIRKNGSLLTLNDNNQLDAKSFNKAVILGQQRNNKLAHNLAERIMEAGATAFIYHEAGVMFNDPKKLLSDLTSTQKELEETKSKLTLVVNNQIPKAQITTELLVNLTGNSYLAHEVYINSCHSKKTTKSKTVWVHKPKKKYAKWFVEVNGQLRVKEKYYQEVKDFTNELKANK